MEDKLQKPESNAHLLPFGHLRFMNAVLEDNRQAALGNGIRVASDIEVHQYLQEQKARMRKPKSRFAYPTLHVPFVSYDDRGHES